MHIGLRAFGASLAIAGAVTVGTIHTAGAATPSAPVSLLAIHGTLDAAVVADARVNYGLDVTGAWCVSTTGGVGHISCTLTGGVIAQGIAYPNPYVPGGIGVAMVYAPDGFIF